MGGPRLLILAAASTAILCFCGNDSVSGDPNQGLTDAKSLSDAASDSRKNRKDSGRDRPSGRREALEEEFLKLMEERASRMSAGELDTAVREAIALEKKCERKAQNALQNAAVSLFDITQKFPGTSAAKKARKSLKALVLRQT